MSKNSSTGDPRRLTLGGDFYTEHVAARLFDFFGDSTPWNRRLWDTGLVVALRELEEASLWRSRNVLSSSAIAYLAHDLEELSGKDRGVGDRDLRVHLRGVLKSGVGHGSRHHRMLTQIKDMVHEGYLRRWSASFENAGAPSPERLARAIASHLLDCGYSMSFLHRWVHKCHSEGRTLGDLLDSGAELASRGTRKFEVVVPFVAVPQAGDLAVHLDEWLSPQDVSRWLSEYADARLVVRQNGGFRYEVDAKDPYAAADTVKNTVDRLRARASYTRKSRRGHDLPEPIGVLWVRNPVDGTCVDIPHSATTTRGAYVLSLQAERRVYDVSRPTALDDALELAAPLNSGSPGPAISGGWAAIEALLVAPTDEQDGKEGRGVVAARRMAALVTCSWPRAELTSLSHQHSPPNKDRLTQELSDASTNEQRAQLVLHSLSAGHFLSLENRSDRAAEQRMIKMIDNPKSTLNDVSKHVTSALRRLYRQRNLLMHGGSTGSIALEATLRTSAPLVGAGLDRITHAALTDELAPLDLATRAELNLQLVGGNDSPSLVKLLE